MLGLDPYVDPSEGDFPNWSIPLLLRLKTKVLKLMRPYYLTACQIDGPVYEDLLIILDSCLPIIPYSHIDTDGEMAKERLDVIGDFLKEWFGEFLDHSLAIKIADLFAGNSDTFRFGRGFRIWNTKFENIWGLVKVIDLERMPIEGKKYCLNYEIVAGPGTGTNFNSVRSGAAIQKRLREIGLPKWKHKYPDEMLYGMHYIGWLGMENERMTVTHLQISNSVKKYNTALMERRMGICTGGYQKLGKPCIPACPFGLDACPLAWHADTYTRNTAHVCRNSKERGGITVYHTGYLSKKSRGICLACTYRGVTEETVRGREIFNGSRAGSSRAAKK